LEFLSRRLVLWLLLHIKGGIDIGLFEIRAGRPPIH